MKVDRDAAELLKEYYDDLEKEAVECFAAVRQITFEEALHALKEP